MPKADALKVLQYLYIGAFFVLDLTVAASNLYSMIFFYGFDLLLAGSLFLFVLVYLGWFVVIRDQEFSGFMRGNQMIKAKLSRAERPRSYWTVFLILGSFHFLLHLSYFDAAHVFSFYSF